MHLGIDSHTRIDDCLFSTKEFKDLTGTQPSLAYKAMYWLSRLSNYIKENPKTFAVGVALLAAGIALGGAGLIAVAGVATIKLLIVVGAALIALPIGWEYAKDELELHVSPEENEHNTAYQVDPFQNNKEFPLVRSSRQTDPTLWRILAGKY